MSIAVTAKDGATSNRKIGKLATPSDLSNRQTVAVSKELNGLVADSLALYLKTKNFHWHMSGPHFRDYHVLLDEQAAQILASVDPLAERVRKIGHRTILGLSHAAGLSTITENLRDFVAPGDMLHELLEDNKAMAANLRKAHGVCDENGDVASASLIEVYIDETERRTWFLFEASRPADSNGH
jgi:starvation-inducible DNA-binding protein